MSAYVVARSRERATTYGAALVLTDKKAAGPDSARVLEPLRVLQAALASEVRAAVGAVDQYDEDSVATVQAQLKPLVRARWPRGSGGAESEEPIEAGLQG